MIFEQSLDSEEWMAEKRLHVADETAAQQLQLSVGFLSRLLGSAAGEESDVSGWNDTGYESEGDVKRSLCFSIAWSHDMTIFEVDKN